MKKSNGRRNRQFAKQVKKRRSVQRPRLQAENLEARLLLAADFDYSVHRDYMDSSAYEGNTNVIQSNDVNNDARVNVTDVMLLIDKARTLVELTGTPGFDFVDGDLTSAAGEGGEEMENIFVDSGGERVFVDTTGDGRFNVLDIFQTMGELRGEGEGNATVAFSFLLYESDNPAFIQNVAPDDTTQGDPNSGKVLTPTQQVSPGIPPVELQTITAGVDANLTVAVSDMRDIDDSEKGVASAYLNLAFEQGFGLTITPRAGAFETDGPQNEGAFVFNSEESTGFSQAGSVFASLLNPLGVTNLGTADIDITGTLNGPSWEMVDVSLNVPGAKLDGVDDLEGVVQGQSVNIDVLANDTLDDIFTVTGSEASDSGTLVTVLNEPPLEVTPNMIDYGTSDFLIVDSDGNRFQLGIINLTQGSKGTASINDNGTPNDTSDDTIDYTANASATGNDTFTYQLTDGVVNGPVVTVTVEIGEVNDPPVLQADSPINTTENNSVGLTGVSVSDPDAGVETLLFTLSASNGNLTLGGTTGLVNLVGDGSTNISFEASQADANAAFTGLTYAPIGEFNGVDTVTITADDQGNTGVGGSETDSIDVTVNVASVNDPPVNTAPAGPLGVFNTETLTINGLSISDIDANGGNVDVTLSVASGTVAFNSTTNLSIIGGGNGTASVTVSGTIADLNTAFAAGVVYDPIDTFIGTDTLSFDSDDNGNTGGPAEQDSTSVDIGVTPPILPFARDDSLTVVEDSGAGASNQVDVLANDLNGLAEIGGANLSVDSFTQGANGSVTEISNGVFEYIPAGDFFGSDSFTYIVSDSVNPGDGPAMGTVNVTVDPMNDAPVLTFPSTATTPEDTVLDFTGALEVSIADIDAGTGNLTVTLSAVNGTLLVNSVDQGAATVLNGTVSQLNAQLATLQFDPVQDFFGSATVNISVDDNNNTGPEDGVDSGTVDITVTSENDAPVVTFPSEDATVTKNFDFVFDSDFPVTVSDVDAGTDLLEVVVGISTADTGPIGSITLGNPGSVTVLAQTATSITFEGTLTNINDALDGLTYSPGTEFVGDVDVDIDVDDRGANGAGGPLSGDATKTIEVLDFIPSTLSGFLFIDGDKDGEKDAVELGIAQMVVTLSGTDITGADITQTTTTDDNGGYSFSNLAPPLQSTNGYTISISQEEASLYKDWTDYIGTQGGAASTNSLLVPTSAFLVNGQPLGGVTGTGNNFTYLGPDAQYVNPLQWILASSLGSDPQTAPNRLLLSVDSNNNATNFINFNGWDGFTDFSLLNINAAGTQATLRAVNGTTTQEVLNFPEIRMLGEDGQGNRMYWIEGSYDDLFSQAQPQAEGEAAPELRYEDQAEIEMLAASMDRESNQDFEQAVDEVFAGEDLA